MTDGPVVVVAGRLDGARAGTPIALADADLHHLRRVLRLVDGAPLRLTDGVGAAAPARLAGERAVLDADAAVVPRPAPRLALAQALTRGRRADDAVRTACELGVDLLVPVVADRTQGRPDPAERAALVGRWRAVAAAALAQSRGAFAAEVAEVTTVAGLAASAPWSGPRLVAVPGAPALPDVLAGIGSAPGPDASVGPVIGVAVGPEGGLTSTEVDGLVAAGWVPVGLGPTVLRSEHAGPVALAVLAAKTGRWAASGYADAAS